MTSVVDIFSSGRAISINSILKGESITKIMTDPSPVCPLIGTDVILGELIGKGNYGEVFSIDFPGRGNREYAVKKAKSFAAVFTNYSSQTFLDLERMYRIKAEKIISYNGLNTKNVKPSYVVPKKTLIPTFMGSCRLQISRDFVRLDKKGFIKFDKGDHLCPVENSEFAISLLTGSLYRAGRSINFLDVFYFASCKDKVITDGSVVNQYTFMERIKSSLRKSVGCICEKGHDGVETSFFATNAIATKRAMNGVVIQIIHAIYLMQLNYKIVHGDLHDDNVFFEFLTADTEWNGQKLLDADYYEYRVKGKSLYVPGGKECPFIIKIGDWGLACKYSSPKIANMETITTGYDQLDGLGPWLPNFYNEVYDMYFIMDILYKLNPSNDFISDIMSWMLDVPPGIPNAIIGASIISSTGRPSITKISSPEFERVSPCNLLLADDVMREFYKVPPMGSKIILLGSD